MAQPSPQAGSITFTGDSGAKYRFEVHPLRTTFRAVGGVYVLLRLDPDGYKVLYVGETGDLSTRFDNHHRAGSFNLHRATHIAVAGESLAARRLAVETDIRRYYCPPCNQQ